MIETKEYKSHDIPGWLTALILLLCLGGGGYMILWYMKAPPRTVLAVPEDKLTPAAKWRGALSGGGGPRAARDTRDPALDGVHVWGPKSFRVKSGNTVMLVTYGLNNRSDISMFYFKTFRTSEQEQLSAMWNSVRQDSTWREYLKVTDEQIAALRKVPPIQGMAQAPPDRLRMTELWTTYKAAADKNAPDKAAAEKTLLAGLDEIGKKNLQPSKDYEQARATAIQAVLTPEQVKLYKGSPSDKPPVPAATPAKAVVPAAAPAPAITPAPAAKVSPASVK